MIKEEKKGLGVCLKYVFHLLRDFMYITATTITITSNIGLHYYPIHVHVHVVTSVHAIATHED